MELLPLDPAKIEVSDRLRAIDTDYVALLAESIRDRGLDAPIRVTVPDETGACRLIAGAHRLAAVLSLGLPEIMAIPFDGTALQAELLEIEENLVRRELSELDRGTFLARHKTVWEALHPDVKHGGDRRKKQVDKDVHLLAERFSAVAAAKLGVDERTIRRAVRRYEMLSPAIRQRVAGTWIGDSGAALDDLIGKGEPLAEAERHAVLDLLLDPDSKVRNVGVALRQIRKVPVPDGAEAEFARLVGAWGKANAPARARFLTWVKTNGKAKA